MADMTMKQGCRADLLSLMMPPRLPKWRDGSAIVMADEPSRQGDMQWFARNWQDHRAGGRWYAWMAAEKIWRCIDPYDQYSINEHRDSPPKYFSMFGYLQASTQPREPIQVLARAGFATVGHFGSDHRMEYTAVGGSVNLASRIEGASAINAITLSRSTYLLVKDHFAISPRGEVTLKGIQQPQQLYEVQANAQSTAYPHSEN